MDKIHICPCCGKSYTRRHTPDSYIGDNCCDCSFPLSQNRSLEVPMFDLDIFEWMVVGPLSEDLADEEERRRLEEDHDQDDEE